MNISFPPLDLKKAVICLDFCSMFYILTLSLSTPKFGRVSICQKCSKTFPIQKDWSREVGGKREALSQQTELWSSVFGGRKEQKGIQEMLLGVMNGRDRSKRLEFFLLLTFLL